jgi:hypothetical protein
MIMCGGCDERIKTLNYGSANTEAPCWPCFKKKPEMIEMWKKYGIDPDDDGGGRDEHMLQCAGCDSWGDGPEGDYDPDRLWSCHKCAASWCSTCRPDGSAYCSGMTSTCDEGIHCVECATPGCLETDADGGGSALVDQVYWKAAMPMVKPYMTEMRFTAALSITKMLESFHILQSIVLAGLPRFGELRWKKKVTGVFQSISREDVEERAKAFDPSVTKKWEKRTKQIQRAYF